MSDGAPQLDQLEAMVNLVLEHTGRLFAEAVKGDSEKALDHGSRLKQMLPRATNGFHDALDQLEEDLNVAKAVMRRDYAVLLAKKAEESKQTSHVNGVKVAKTENETPQALDIQDGDVDMSDAKDSTSDEVTKDLPPKNGAADSAQASVTEDMKQESSSLPTDQKEAAPAKPASPLQVDTSAAQQKDAAPNESGATTAGYSAMDFDSLFNDPNSAAANDASPASSAKDPASTAEAAATTSGNDSSNSLNNGFSFEAFDAQHQDNADNDSSDITSLLPGLESYANAAADGQDDFTMPDFGPAGNEGDKDVNDAGSGDQNAGGQPARDTTFDDLMNFGDFDMSALDAGNGSFEDGENKFDESFFDLE